MHSKSRDPNQKEIPNREDPTKGYPEKAPGFEPDTENPADREEDA